MTIIGERFLSLDDEERAVRLSVFEPIKTADNSGFTCSIEISGLSIPKQHTISGRDSLEALVGALLELGRVVHSSPEYSSGRLRWIFDSSDLGLPRR